MIALTQSGAGAEWQKNIQHQQRAADVSSAELFSDSSAGKMPAALYGSWSSPVRFFECIGTMNLKSRLNLNLNLPSTIKIKSRIKSKKSSAKSETDARFMESTHDFCAVHWDRSG